jgi:hypothetical protein
LYLILASLSCSESFFLQENNFSGELPPEMANLRLRELQAQNNNFSGEIPEALFSNVLLEALRLDNNSLSGPISASIGDLSALEDIRLNNNTLTGQIPVTLWRLERLSKYARGESSFGQRGMYRFTNKVFFMVLHLPQEFSFSAIIT